MIMPGRSYSPTNEYRYGFNGKENDKDISAGGQDYGMRIYDSRLGKFLSVDPLKKEYPELTPYQFASNSPIEAIDLDGLERYHYTLKYTEQGKPVLKQYKVENFSESKWAWNPKEGGTDLGFQLWQKNTTRNPRKEIIYHGTAEVVFGEGLYSSFITYELSWKFGSVEEMAAAVGSGKLNYLTSREKSSIINLQAATLALQGMSDMGDGLSSLGQNLVKTESKLLNSAAKEVTALRGAYVAEVEGLSSIASKMRGAGNSSEEIARALHGVRRELGVKYKSLTPDNMLQQIYQRNLQKYGDKLGPTIDYLRQQGKSWDDIINSATRPGGKDLGF